MHKVTGVGTPSAKPDGIPVSELTYGTALSLADVLLPCLDETGFSIVVDKATIQKDIEFIIEVMPWGVLATSNIKLGNRIIGFLDVRGDASISIWNETKRILIEHTSSIALVTDVIPENLGIYIQTFVNESLLTYLVGDHINSVVNPELLGASEYDYAVAMATLAYALICASSSYNGLSPNQMSSQLRAELRDMASTR